MNDKRDTLTEADKAELAAWWKEKKRQRPPVRMQCSPSSPASDEHCGRILYCQDSTPFRCRSCGHGTMREPIPKTHCCECGEPIYDNVDADHKVVCGKCVADKVEAVRWKEKRSETEFKDTKDMFAKMKAAAEYLQTEGGRLRSIRLDLGLNTNQLGERLGVPFQNIAAMEKNQMELSEAAREFVASRGEGKIIPPPKTPRNFFGRKKYKTTPLRKAPQMQDFSINKTSSSLDARQPKVPKQLNSKTLSHE